MVFPILKMSPELIGVEIFSIEDDSRDAVIEYIEEEKLIAYIPMN